MPQTVKVVFPPGLSEITALEVNAILQSLWFPQKYQSEIIIEKNSLRIEPIHLFAATEILMRSQCSTDVRLVLWEGKTFGKSVFVRKCKEVDWDMFLNKSMTIRIKVNSVASRAFHETGLKEILSDIVGDKVNNIVTGEEEATTTLYADLHNDRLSLSLSLAGDALYRRGYRGVLSASAPLREDAAAACLRQGLQFARSQRPDFIPDTAFIPFVGTGTFLFEMLIEEYQLSPVLFGREYALQKMPFFREENFQYLLKKAGEYRCSVVDKPMKYVCLDNSKSANSAFLENLQIFQQRISVKLLQEDVLVYDDFFTVDLIEMFAKAKQVFMPLNPPYGMRLGRQQDSVLFYKNIAKRLNEIANLLMNHQGCLAGFILCPTEEAWRGFTSVLKGFKIDTFHFMQGGVDVRVCGFVSG